MQDVLWEVVPEAGVVASAGVVGGSLLKLLDTFGAAAAGVSGVAVGAVSATVGALAAKTFTDRHDRLAVEKRLMDVKRHAPQSSPLSVQPLLAIRQMLEAMDWCLAHEEEHWSRHGAASLAMNCFSGGRGLDNIPKDCKPDKDYRRHLKKIRSLCSPSPLRGQGGRVKNTKTEKRGKTTRDAGVISGLSVPGSSEAYERLFNPQWGTVRSKQGVCAALAYLVTQFMELRHCPTGSLLDGDRRSLRLAVAALARHHVFDEDEKASHALKFTRLLHPTLANAEQDEIDDEEHKRWKNNPDQEQELPRSVSNYCYSVLVDETIPISMLVFCRPQLNMMFCLARFRSAALALICLLDAALAWRPSDPLGWMGQAEDAEGAVLAREMLGPGNPICWRMSLVLLPAEDCCPC